MLRKFLNIQYPIFLAPMAGVSTPKLAAEVSNSGGLGSLGLGSCNHEEAKKQIEQLKQLTSLPFQVNFFCHQPEKSDATLENQWVQYCCSKFGRIDLMNNFSQAFSCLYSSFLENDNFLDLVIQEKVPAVSFHFGIPSKSQIYRLKQANIVTMASATNLIEASYIARSGIDIIIAQGIEAGGHRGVFNPNIDSAIPTLELVFLIKNNLSIPVVAAGGIMDAQDIHDCLRVGANGVQLGTAFVQCSSSKASETYRQSLFNSKVTQITATISGRPARGLVNDWHLKIDSPDRPLTPPYPYTYYFAKKIYEYTRQPQYAAFWAGSKVSKIKKMEASDLMKSFIENVDF